MNKPDCPSEARMQIDDLLFNLRMKELVLQPFVICDRLEAIKTEIVKLELRLPPGVQGEPCDDYTPGMPL